MRIRTIKPEFWDSESMGRVSRDARLLFIGLWSLADDSGKTRADSRFLASRLFPYDDDAKRKVHDWLVELSNEGAVRLYEVNGDHYLDIPRWLNHQKIDHPSPSRIPEFAESSRILANPREHSPLEQGTGNRDQGNGTGNPYSPQTAPSGAARCSDSFNTFWSSYPRKAGKGAAQKAFEKIHPNPETLGAMIEAIGWQSQTDQWTRDGGQFIPHPATWLNQRRWEDEPARVAPKQEVEKFESDINF